MANELIYIESSDRIEDDMLNMVNKHSREVKRQEEIKAAYKKGRQDERNFVKRKIHNKCMKVLSCLVYGFSALIIIWFFASWLNVVINNSSPETIKNIWDLNFFKVVF